MLIESPSSWNDAVLHWNMIWDLMHPPRTFPNGHTVESYLESLPDNITSLVLSQYYLAEIPSLKRFTQLKHVELSWNSLSTLPEMPEGVETLMCSYNQITTLRNLPSTIRILIADYNHVSILEGLPPSITHLNVSYNRIYAIDTLPPNVEVFYCCHNHLCFIGSLLSSTRLKRLEISHNQLGRLPKMAEGVERLHCNNNKLTSLENTASTVLFLYANNNLLTSLRGVPESVTDLCVSWNRIQEVDAFPPRIYRFNGVYNQLRQLPALVPETLKTLCVMNNHLRNLPQLPEEMHQLNFDSNPVYTMVNLPCCFSETTPGQARLFETLQGRCPIIEAINPFTKEEMNHLPQQHILEVCRTNLQKVNRFREKYYTWKYKWAFWRMRRPYLERRYHPERLQQVMDAAEKDADGEVDLETLLQHF